MVDGHLEDFGFLEFGASLLLEGGRNESSEFEERRVDPISTPLLDHAAPLLTVVLLAARLRGRAVGGRGRRRKGLV